MSKSIANSLVCSNYFSSLSLRTTLLLLVITATENNIKKTFNNFDDLEKLFFYLAHC